MAIRTYRPYTKSRRSMTNSTFEDITKSTPEKSLLGRVKKTGGRNNQGKITCRHIGHTFIDYLRSETLSARRIRTGLNSANFVFKILRIN